MTTNNNRGITDANYVSVTFDEIKERLLSFEGNIIDIDGIRVETEEGWFLMRASNTQNQLTCRVESTSAIGLKKLIKVVENQLDLSNVNFKFTI